MPAKRNGPPRVLMEDNWGKKPSLHRMFVSDTLDVLSRRPDFVGTVANDALCGWLSDRLPEILALNDTP
jgi:hypothetical protein